MVVQGDELELISELRLWSIFDDDDDEDDNDDNDDDADYGADNNNNMW